jgi:hypothetical protein
VRGLQGKASAARVEIRLRQRRRTSLDAWHDAGANGRVGTARMNNATKAAYARLQADATINDRAAP